MLSTFGVGPPASSGGSVVVILDTRKNAQNEPKSLKVAQIRKFNLLQADLGAQSFGFSHFRGVSKTISRHFGHFEEQGREQHVNILSTVRGQMVNNQHQQLEE